MSWASRRRGIYLASTVAFFAVIVGGPLSYWYFSIPATCHDGIRNQGETSADKGGPCLLLDERAIQPYGVLWTRAFKVRDGTYNAIAYLQNPNKGAGVASARYRFSLYDADNILIAEREGGHFIMPGSITPIFESRIDTGNRIVARTYFEFTTTLMWERMQNNATVIAIGDKVLSDTGATPRLTARVENGSVADLFNPAFVSVVYDTFGNALAASQTTLSRLNAGSSEQIVFTWPAPFSSSVGRVDITPLLPPTAEAVPR
ncbi:MAG: hypothetical protein U1D26_00465 [Patescibacteria group bacterium]|nr:hypothetical protein [Patescibacteria group bacterium]